MVFWVGHFVLKRIIIQPKLNERRAYLIRYTLGSIVSDWLKAVCNLFVP